MVSLLLLLGVTSAEMGGGASVGVFGGLSSSENSEQDT
jgi:hypothetical protein